MFNPEGLHIYVSVSFNSQLFVLLRLKLNLLWFPWVPSDFLWREFVNVELIIVSFLFSFSSWMSLIFQIGGKGVYVKKNPIGYIPFFKGCRPCTSIRVALVDVGQFFQSSSPNCLHKYRNTVARRRFYGCHWYGNNKCTAEVFRNQHILIQLGLYRFKLHNCIFLR